MQRQTTSSWILVLTVSDGSVITINGRVLDDLGMTIAVGQSTTGVDGEETNLTSISAFAEEDVDENKTYTLSGEARYIHIYVDNITTDGDRLQVDFVYYDDHFTSSASCLGPGNPTAVQSSNGVGVTDRLVGFGSNDGRRVTINNNNDYVILDMGQTLPAGLEIEIDSRARDNTSTTLEIGQSTTGTDGDETNRVELSNYAAIDT